MKQGYSFERIVGFLAIGIVFLNFTNVYTFLAGLTGVSFRHLGIVFMVVMSGYIVGNISVVSSIFRSRPIIWFLILFVGLPILSSVYSPYFSFRYIGYLINMALIFLVSAIWIRREGWELFSRLLILSWGLCIFGITLSYFIPHVFERVALMEESATYGTAGIGALKIAQESAARAFGFQMQSNKAAFAVIVHLVLLVPIYLHDRPMGRLLLLGGSFAAILLTGSRGGFLLFSIFCCVLAFMEVVYGVKVRGRSVSRFLMIPRYALLVLASVLMLALVQVYSVSNSRGETAVTRILNSLFSSDHDIVSDNSFMARFEIQRIFVHQIIQNPVLGRGLAASEFDRYTGRIPLSAHNNYLDLAYEFGVPAMLIMYGLLFYVCIGEQSRRCSEFFRYRVSWIIIMMICAASFLSNTIVDYRVFPVLIAFWFMLIYYPVPLASRRSVGN